jgi:putative membrane protein
MKIIIKWLLTSAVIVVASLIIPGVVLQDFWAAVIAAMVLALLNLFLKPLLIILTLPINLLTLGLFTLVINTAIVMLVSAIVPGFYIDGAWWAFLFSIVISLFNSLINIAGGK